MQDRSGIYFEKYCDLTVAIIGEHDMKIAAMEAAIYP